MKTNDMQTEGEIPVFLSSDAGYAPYMAVLMISIMDHTNANVIFYILDGGMGAHTRKQILSLKERWRFEVEFINMDAYRKSFQWSATHSGRVTQSSSDRLLIPLIKPNLDKAIILDADMIALGDIRKLWDVDLEGNVLAAVPAYLWHTMDIIKNHTEKTGMSPNHIYFNMGTLLVDLKKWREEDLTAKLLSINIKFSTKEFYWWEEVILNLVLQENNYKILDPMYGMTAPLQAFCKCGKPEEHRQLVEHYAKLPSDYRIDEIIFFHFAPSQTKPWNTRLYWYSPAKTVLEITGFRDFWNYMKLTPFYGAELVSFLDKRFSTVDNRVKRIIAENENKKSMECENKKEKLENLIREYVRYEFLTRLTVGLIPKFSRKAKEYMEKIKNV